MNKILCDFLAILLCFCMICSLCGVGFAAAEGEAPSLDTAPPVVDDWDDGDLSLEFPSPEPEPDPEPDPVDTPAPDLGADDGGEPDPDEGGDTPSPEPDASLSPVPGDVAPSVPVVVAPAPEITYVELPEDYVIKSAGLDGLYSIDPQSVLGPVTSSKTSGLKAVLLSILGSYDPIVAEYQYISNGSSYYNYLREIQPDYVWLASAVIFAILLYCTWRILGGLVCRK